MCRDGYRGPWGYNPNAQLKIGIDDRELLGAVDAEVYRSSLRQAKTRALARRMLCLLYTSRCV